MKKSLFALCLCAPLAMALPPAPRTMPPSGMDKALLGQILFFDTALSLRGNQNCASCHHQDTAFVDLRDNHAAQKVSQGDDPNQFGRRNAPTMLYAKFSPAFHYDSASQSYVGGQFWDGRAQHLAEQAGMPPLDPAEMGMPSKLAVAERLISLPMYQRFFTQFYGEGVWQSENTVYAAMEDALATFQQEKALLAPFDSRYDKFLRNTARLSPLEEQGRALFFDRSKTNCTQCHQASQAPETFSDYRYYNLRVPPDRDVLALQNAAAPKDDLGLAENPRVAAEHRPNARYAFKTPTLRNVAVTAPYMHNGTFRELRTVLLYLDHFNNPARNINPETGKAWELLPFAENFPQDKFRAPPLSDSDIDALEAFLKTLTDERYEPLLAR